MQMQDHATSVETHIEATILARKKALNAVILAHYYQAPEIQDIADFIGDSLELSRKAANTDADVIVFCGVSFMAEVAKILSPSKKVLIPDAAAGCSLEDACPADKFQAFRKAHPDHIAISYINCSAAVKALSDIIVTSSNAERIINSIPKEQPILFAPDKYLGGYLAKKTGRDMLLWDGSCMVHEHFSEKELVALTVRYPEARVIAHPECPPHLLRYAHHIGSTSSLLNDVASHADQTFIVLTEPGILHQMQKKAPKATLLQVPGVGEGSCSVCNTCPHMRKNTLEKIDQALQHGAPEITLDEPLRLKAKAALDRMLALS